MKEIKLVFGKGGKTKILAGGSKGQGTSALTEKIAKDLGQTEERHKGQEFEQTNQDNQIKQGH